MKKNLLSVTAILAIGFFTTNAVAQKTDASASSVVSARLIKPLSIRKTGVLNFGTINVFDSTGGFVTITPAAVRSFTGGTANGRVGDAATTPAYAVAGTKNSTYTLTLPGDGEVSVYDADNNSFMQVDGFNAKFAYPLATANDSKLSTTGTDDFTVGATLVVARDQSTGIYTGSFDVSVDYN